MKHKSADAARAVIIFAKAPEKGKVKTRLARDMDEDLVVPLYRKLVEQTLETVLQTPFLPIICFSPAEKEQIGYWLIGFNKNGFSPHVFADIPWSTAHVLGDTMEKCAGLGLSAALAAKLRDLDTVEDLSLLWRNIQR